MIVIGTKYYRAIAEKLNITNVPAGNLSYNSDLYSRLLNERYNAHFICNLFEVCEQN